MAIHQNVRATSRMGGATSFPYPALRSRFKSLLNAPGAAFWPVRRMTWASERCLTLPWFQPNLIRNQQGQDRVALIWLNTWSKSITTWNDWTFVDYNDRLNAFDMLVRDTLSLILLTSFFPHYPVTLTLMLSIEHKSLKTITPTRWHPIVVWNCMTKNVFQQKN